LGAAGFSRDNNEVTYNAEKGINDDRKGRGVEVRYFQRVRGKQAVLKCEPARSGGGTSEARWAHQSSLKMHIAPIVINY